MLPIALVATLAFSLGPLSSIPFAHLALVSLLAPWLVVSSTAVTFIMLDSLQNAFRYGLRGFSYSQQWHEVARATLIAGVLLTIATFAAMYCGFSIIKFTLLPIGIFLGLFFIGSVIGYMIAGKNPPIGRAYETIDFFFPQFLAGLIVFIPMILFGNIVHPTYIVAGTAILAVLTVIAIKLFHWRGATKNKASQPPDSTNP